MFDGFLFIGDPHVSSKRIGRRSDDYLGSVLSKLSQAAEIAREKNLVPVILGDLLHRNDDSNLVMLNRLMRTLKSFHVTPWVLEGNHDKEQTELSDADALTLLEQGQAVRLLTLQTPEVVFEMAGTRVRLLGFPYGSEIPQEVAPFDGATVAVSHHDLAFDTSYPGSLPLREVKNCAAVVNGHMHDTKPSKTVGETVWHNPGNIEPLSVDLAAHVPSVAVWTPAQPQALSLVALSHNTDCFDLTGLQVAAATGAGIVEGHQAAASAFAAMLQEQGSLDAARTDDAAILLEDLADVLDTASVSSETKVLLQSLAADLVEAVSLA